ncbi:hypothetical protein JB92DRAFT_2738854 [Gautieria morchelliformis]|nr:hypothetical protein JB92DRAFT_2738854 [Gautieria morchelliformis]
MVYAHLDSETPHSSDFLDHHDGRPRVVLDVLHSGKPPSPASSLESSPTIPRVPSLAPGSDSRPQNRSPFVVSVESDVQITRNTSVLKLITYSIDAHVEYPETSAEGWIGHLFKLDPEAWVNPRENICYSQGGPMGQTLARTPVFCKVLADNAGRLVPCVRSHSTCQGVKVCPKASIDVLRRPHTCVTAELLKERLAIDKVISNSDAHMILERTVAYMHALRKHGCGAPLCEPTAFTPEERADLDAQSEIVEKERRGRRPVESVCEGRLLFNVDEKGDAFVWSLDWDYLEASFAGDKQEVARIERAAEYSGYGPLASCTTVTNFSSQRLVCPCPHRSEDGQLASLEMKNLSCTSKFTVYTPLEDYRDVCPHVLIICSGSHHHPAPLPSTTPPLVRQEILHMLKELEHDIPGMTLHGFLHHKAVRSRLQQLLPDLHNPTLVDLHVSLANKERLQQYIKLAKSECFPHGTGWEGAKHLKSLNDSGEFQNLYIRFIGAIPPKDVERREVRDQGGAGDEPYRFVICMTPTNSWRILRAEYLRCDISQRVVGYEEFELGGWDAEAGISINYCRVFINRPCADAYLFVFRKITELVRNDTGQHLRWRHFHSLSVNEPVGIKLFVVDEHGDQVKGLGLYLQEVAQHAAFVGQRDLHEPLRLLSQLSPCEHLHRIVRLCNAYVCRNIKKGTVSDGIKNEMRGLLCLSHEDWDGALERICVEGGKTGRDWVEDKIRGGWVFPAMCWEKSKIPLAVWQAGERHGNLVEASHVDANKEGPGGTLLGRIKKGLWLDQQKIKNVQVWFYLVFDRSDQHRGRSGCTAVPRS